MKRWRRRERRETTTDAYKNLKPHYTLPSVVVMSTSSNKRPKGTHFALAQTLEGHEECVWHAAWSHDGQLLATCGGDRSIRVWSESGGSWTCLALLEESQERTVRCVEWSYCGTYLAAASFDATVVIWEHRGGEFEVIATLEGHENEVKCVAWNVAGTLLATCSRDKVRQPR